MASNYDAAYMESRAAAFWSCVRKHENGCWVWTRKPSAQGYGKFSIADKEDYAHRVAWRLTHGALSSEASVRLRRWIKNGRDAEAAVLASKNNRKERGKQHEHNN